jgi:hypothetical protein
MTTTDGGGEEEEAGSYFFSSLYYFNILYVVYFFSSKNILHRLNILYFVLLRELVLFLFGRRFAIRGARSTARHVEYP